MSGAAVSSDVITHHLFGPDDLDRLMAVAPGLFDNPILPDQAAAFLADPLHELILTYAGDHAVGLISATVLLHPDKQPAMFINELEVRESHQRRGIATGLIDAMIARARERGCRGIWLGAETTNTTALAFYRSLKPEELTGSFFGWDDAF